MRRAISFLVVACSVVLSQSSAFAQQCAAHYKFDGNTSDSSAGGMDAYLADSAKSASSLQFTDGNYGQALVLDGETVLRLPLDLSFDNCPQFTISAWIQVPQALPKGTFVVLGTGSGNTPGLSLAGASVTARGSANGITQKGVFYGSPEWVFVAAVYDRSNDSFRLHWRHKHTSKTLGSTATAADSSWIGALTQQSSTVATGIIVDDLRVYPQALTVENIADIRKGQASPPGSRAEFASSAGLEGGACSAHDQCGDGFYCAFDGTCHPDRHAPMQGFELVVMDAQAGTTLMPLPAEDADASSNAGGGATTPQNSAPYPVGEPTITEYSGSIGSISRTLDHGSDSRFLTGIEWQEVSDRPCAMMSVGHQYGREAGEPPQGTESTDFDCGRGFSIFGFDNFKVRTSVTTPIYAIQVCNNGRNAKRRLKGVRVYGATIHEDGTTSAAHVNDEEVLPNCNDWSELRACPADQVATGIVVLAKEDGSGDKAGITALRLICRSIGVP